LNLMAQTIVVSSKTLVEALNNLHSAMLKGEGRSEVGSTSKFLLDYAASHFAMEEKMMDSQAYPGLSSHKKLHVDLITSFTKMINGFEWESRSLTLAVLVSLEEWVAIHFMNEDAKFVKFIKNNDSSAAPGAFSLLAPQWEPAVAQQNFIEEQSQLPRHPNRRHD